MENDTYYKDIVKELIDELNWNGIFDVTPDTLKYELRDLLKFREDTIGSNRAKIKTIMGE